MQPTLKQWWMVGNRTENSVNWFEDTDVRCTPLTAKITVSARQIADVENAWYSSDVCVNEKRFIEYRSVSRITMAVCCRDAGRRNETDDGRSKRNATAIE